MKKKTNRQVKPKKRAKAYVKKITKPVPSPEFNMNHPDVKDSIEYAFTVDKKDFYRFKDEREIPSGRYIHIDAFLKEHEIRMSIGTLQGYIDAMKEALKFKAGEFNPVPLTIILHKLETRTNLAFSVDTIKRLASVIYFDHTENLQIYDPEYGAKKIKQWDLHGFIGFFLQTPIKELLGLQDITETSLQNFIQTQSQIMRDLISIQPTSSEVDS